MSGSRQSPTAAFGVVYWGSCATEGWDLDTRSRMPWICQHCDAVADTWRGRFESAQVALRMCAGEGCGFKQYVQSFLMLSAKASVGYNLPVFYRWSAARRTKVLSERLVVGTPLEVWAGRLPAGGECGVCVDNAPGAWLRALQGLARQLQAEAHAARGAFGALLLDSSGRELRLAEMLAHPGGGRIERLLILLGGPDGMPSGTADKLEHVLKEFTDFPLLHCSLPGDDGHSSYGLAALFVFHDQGVLLPFLARLAWSSTGPQPPPAPADDATIGGLGVAATPGPQCRKRQDRSSPGRRVGRQRRGALHAVAAGDEPGAALFQDAALCAAAPAAAPPRARNALAPLPWCRCGRHSPSQGGQEDRAIAPQLLRQHMRRPAWPGGQPLAPWASVTSAGRRGSS